MKMFLASLAVSVGRHLGLQDTTIQNALWSVDPEAGRCRLLDITGVRIIDDAYNASPVSVEAALQLLADTPAKRRIAVLGEMLDLGEAAEQLHRHTAEAIPDCVDLVIAVGRFADAVRSPANARCRIVAGIEEVSEELRRIAKPGDAILIKASNATGLSAVVQLLVEELRSRVTPRI